MNFTQWLINNKKYSERAARDVKSRLKRVRILLNEKEISQKSVDILNQIEDFQKLSTSVKSQLRRSIKLFAEYDEFTKRVNIGTDANLEDCHYNIAETVAKKSYI